MKRREEIDRSENWSCVSAKRARRRRDKKTSILDRYEYISTNIGVST